MGQGVAQWGNPTSFLVSFTWCSQVQSSIVGQWSWPHQVPFCVVLCFAETLPVAVSPRVLGSNLWVLECLRISLWASWFDVPLAGDRIPGLSRHQIPGLLPVLPVRLDACLGVPQQVELDLSLWESQFCWNETGGGSLFIYSDLASALAFILNSSFSSGKCYSAIFLLADICFLLV